jgi:hypothetical protein
MQIYLNYNPYDASHAAELRTLMKEEGFDVWDANLEVLPGDDWPERYEEGLRESTAMILVISPMMLKSPLFLREVGYVLRHIRFAHRFVVAFTKPVEKLKDVPWVLMNKVIHRVNLFPGREKKVAAKIARVLNQNTAEAVPA